MAFDVARIRALYPALQSGTVYLDGAAGTQSPLSVIDAIADAYRRGTSNGGGFFDSSVRADYDTAAAREAVADLVNGDPRGRPRPEHDHADLPVRAGVVGDLALG